jgi:hypothetical protein
VHAGDDHVSVPFDVDLDDPAARAGVLDDPQRQIAPAELAQQGE